MKKISVYILLLFLSYHLISAQKLPSLIPFKSGDKFGYVNSRNNKMVIQPKFNGAYPFYNKQQVAFAHFNGHPVIINTKGEIIYQYAKEPLLELLEYELFESFNTWFPDLCSDSIQFIEQYFAPPFYQTNDFIVVQDSGSVFLLDKNGIKCSKNYDYVAPVNNSRYFIARMAEKYGILNSKGKEIISPQYKNYQTFGKSILVKLSNDSTINYFDFKTNSFFHDSALIKKTKKKVENSAHLWKQLKKGYELFYTKQRFGLINPHKDTIHKDFHYIFKLIADRLYFRNDSIYGIMNHKGKVILSRNTGTEHRLFTYVPTHRNKSFTLMENGKYNIYNYKGKRINKLPYTCIIANDPNSNYYVAMRNKFIWVIDKKGRERFKTSYLGNCSENLFLSKKNKWGVVDINGKLVIDHIYDYPFYFYENVTLVKENGDSYYINSKGFKYKE